MAVTIPGKHCLASTLKPSSDLVTPREREASVSPGGEVFIASSMALIMMGRMNSPTTMIPASREVLKPSRIITVKPMAP